MSLAVGSAAHKETDITVFDHANDDHASWKTNLTLCM